MTNEQAVVTRITVTAGRIGSGWFQIKKSFGPKGELVSRSYAGMADLNNPKIATPFQSTLTNLQPFRNKRAASIAKQRK